MLVTSIVTAETFYVAPDGNDSGAGTIGDPWATLAGAGDNIRPLLDGTGDITVYFRGGTYYFGQTVVFGLADSGTANQVITYKAYPGETPVFSSLKQVTGWTTYSGNIKQANLPGGISHVRYLQDSSEDWMPRSATAYFNPADTISYCNEESMYESSYGGYSNVQQYKTFTRYPSSGWGAPDWGSASQYDLRISTMAWTVNVLPISSVNAGNRRINVATPATYEMKNANCDGAPTEAWVLNTVEGINSAGEWACLNGKIYLYPKSGTDDIYVPTVTEFVRVDEGTTDGNQNISTPVEYINFEGITFTGGDYYIRQYDYGNPLNSDVTSQHDWGIVDVPAGMLRFRNAANCKVDGCSFTKSGAGGVRLDRYCQNITVNNCDFSYLGREAVSLMGRGIGYGNVNKNNEISHNDIIATGREKWDAPAINLSQSSNNSIHHNFIDDTHMTAIIFTSSRGVYLAYKCYEGSDSYFIGSECHYWECHPTAVATSCNEGTYGYEEAKIESHKYMYNYDNVIEKNVITNAHNGGQFFHNDISLTNGIIYTSGGKFDQSNCLQLNYFYDCDPNPNTQLLYADTYMDHMHALKNMMYNVQIGNGSTEAYVLFDVFCNWQDWNVQHGNQQGYVNANASKNSSFWQFTYGMFINTDGNIDFDDNNPAGSSAFVNDYEQMYATLCPGVLPGPDPLPGASSIQSSLASKIIEFGGTVPNCLVPDIDGDGDVDFLDFANWSTQWMQTGCGACDGADFTGEGDVNVNDLDIFADNWLRDYGLLGYWQLDGDANDSSGYGNDGTVHGGAVWIDDSNRGWCLSFDGGDDYVQVPADVSLNAGKITMAAWVKASNAAPDIGMHVLNRQMAQPGTYALWLTKSNYKWVAQIRLDGDENNGIQIYSNAVAATDWTHIAATYDGSDFKMYINGILQTDTAAAVGSIDDDYSDIVTIGAHPNPTAYFEGLIDEVIIYDKALNQQEIEKLAGI